MASINKPHIKKLLSWDELLNRLEIKEIQIIAYLEKGLQPYSEYLVPLECPYYCHLHGLKTKQINELIEDFKILEKFIFELEKEIARKKKSVLEMEAPKKIMEYLFSYEVSQIFYKSNIQLSDPKNTLLKLKVKKDDLTKEIKRIKIEIDNITDDDPFNASWKYFIKPSDKQETRSLLMVLEKALFIEDNAIEIKEKIDLKEKKEVKIKNDIILPCKPGTKWEDIKITLIKDELVRIITPDGEGLFTYHQLGMADRRKGDQPTMLWGLFKMFAEYRGFISSKHIEHYDPAIPNTTKRLNINLQKVFGINESIYTAHYKKAKGYKTKIFFSDARDVTSTYTRKDNNLL